MDLDGFLDISAAYQAITHHTDAHQAAVDPLRRTARQERNLRLCTVDFTVSCPRFHPDRQPSVMI